MQQMLDKLDVIERFEAPGYQPRVGEVLREQEELYAIEIKAVIRG